MYEKIVYSMAKPNNDPYEKGNVYNKYKRKKIRFRIVRVEDVITYEDVVFK